MLGSLPSAVAMGAANPERSYRGLAAIQRRFAFTLIELLVVVAIIGVLASLLLPALARSRGKARAVQCASQLRQVALAIRMYVDDNADTFPRSQHSAFTHAELPWGRAIAPFLGQTGTRWTNLLQGIYRCPADRRATPWSYGANVYFELEPGGDDYEGQPRTWRQASSIPRPASTIQQAESVSSADHIMPHFWMSAADATDVDNKRHGGRGQFSFVDGHVAAQRLRDTYEPSNHVDLWNPLR